MNKRFWECECCGSMLVTLPQDDASRYQCPQCVTVKCSHGGRYVEVSAESFMKLAELTKLDALLRLFELAKREHYNCDDDNWYGCPLSESGCSNDNVPKDKCNCSADERNAEVAKIRSLLLPEVAA